MLSGASLVLATAAGGPTGLAWSLVPFAGVAAVVLSRASTPGSAMLLHMASVPLAAAGAAGLEASVRDSWPSWMPLLAFCAAAYLAGICIEIGRKFGDASRDQEPGTYVHSWGLSLTGQRLGQAALLSGGATLALASATASPAWVLIPAWTASAALMAVTGLAEKRNRYRKAAGMLSYVLGMAVLATAIWSGWEAPR
jgi:hypothetical protein